MNEQENKDMLDLGSAPIDDDFDPFADFEEPENGEFTEETSGQPAQESASAPNTTETNSSAKAQESKDSKTEQELDDKPPVFEYAGAAENIDDTSKTFDELRIDKSGDFPELEDGKRVSWIVEYGKITKTVADPKGMSIGKMKSDIEASKEFIDSLKKAKDKNPVCKLKPRVTAQSKGRASTYKGVFTSIKEAEESGKVISIVPAKDGKIYEIRNTEMGKFITQTTECDMLSEVQAGFTPALPLIPMDMMMRIVAFFRYYMQNGVEKEALLNVYYDTHSKEFFIDAPEQTVAKASVDSKISEEYANERYIHYMDIHSHNSMKAFFSAVDDNDEKATRLYAVIGNLHEYFPDIKIRISNGGKFCEIDPAEVFELVARPFPNEWKENVHFRDSHDADDFDYKELGRKFRGEADYL